MDMQYLSVDGNIKANSMAQIVLLADVIKDMTMDNEEVSGIYFNCVNETEKKYQCNPGIRISLVT